MIQGLHHNAYRCRDSEETRRFYEDFLGLPLAETLEIGETKSGRKTNTLHTFYRLGDGSYLAFFEAPDMPFEFKAQHDFDLHIALEVDAQTLHDHAGQGQGGRHRDPRHLGPRLHPLDLFPRSERLRDRAHRQAAGPRRRHGSRPATARARSSIAGRAPSSSRWPTPSERAGG